MRLVLPPQRFVTEVWSVVSVKIRSVNWRSVRITMKSVSNILRSVHITISSLIRSAKIVNSLTLHLFTFSKMEDNIAEAIVDKNRTVQRLTLL